jgi:hemolysin activation/secretion protein
MTLVARGAGQFAVEPVISNEQFSIAGYDGTRGYLEAEELGDIGIRGSLELFTPAWTLTAPALRSQVFVFLDGGRMSYLAPLPDQPTGAALASFGLGLRFGAFEHVSGGLTWAQTIYDGSRTPAGESRLHFSIKAEL